MNQVLKLKDLIASSDFTGRRIRDDEWCFDAEEMEKMLYERPYPGWDGQEHQAAFYETAKMAIVEIAGWTCTDTGVGLDIITFNETPVAICWQAFRRGDRTYAFVSQEAADLVASAWERSRPKPQVIIASEQTLSMPVAAVGAKPFKLEKEFGLDASDVVLSIDGYAICLTEIAGDDSLDEITDIDLLNLGLHVSDLNIERELRNIASYESSLRDHDDNRDDDDSALMRKEVDQMKNWISLVQRELLGPIQSQLYKLADKETTCA
jgi:hypothetical protein